MIHRKKSSNTYFSYDSNPPDCNDEDLKFYNRLIITKMNTGVTMGLNEEEAETIYKLLKNIFED